MPAYVTAEQARRIIDAATRTRDRLLLGTPWNPSACPADTLYVLRLSGFLSRGSVAPGANPPLSQRTNARAWWMYVCAVEGFSPAPSTSAM